LKIVDGWFLSAAAAAAVYLLTALAVLIGRVRYDRIRRAIDHLIGIFGGEAGAQPAPPYGRGLAIKYLSSLSCRQIRRIVADASLPREVNDMVCRHLLDRLGIERVQRDAMARRGMRSRWRRMAALRLLAFGRPDDAWAAIKKALIDSDPRVVSAAVTILGNMNNPRAAELLVKALRVDCYPPSRISSFLDRSPFNLATLLGPLLRHPRPSLRYWGAILLRRYPRLERGVEALEALTRDEMPMVRRAAVESLSLLGGSIAVEAARRLLADKVGFVRAHAARALGTLRAQDAAPAVAALLADREWWVRYAAKVSLETMGPDIMPHLLSLLNHPDDFARNGAAEVLQNLGVFDRLLVDEAAGPSQPERLAILRQLTQAGGVRMSEAMVDRLPRDARVRASSLLVSLGVKSEGIM
jgi:HEAT repeat protein